MKHPTCLIAEDEQVLLAELRDALVTLWPELEVVAECSDGAQAARAFASRMPDILFLDIQMPALTGLEVAALASRRCHVVFVTAYDSHAVAAFEHGAVDYVLKPFSMARIADTVARLKERIPARPADLDGLLQMLARKGDAHDAPLRWIRASAGAEVSLLTVDEVLFFQSDFKTTLVVMEQREAVIRLTIQELGQRLDPDVFWQIHRGTIVNLNAISAVHRQRNGTLQVQLRRHPRRLIVSATFAHLFRQM